MDTIFLYILEARDQEDLGLAGCVEAKFKQVRNRVLLSSPLFFLESRSYVLRCSQEIGYCASADRDDREGQISDKMSDHVKRPVANV